VRRSRKTEISLELSEVVAIRIQKVWMTWCADCHQRVRMISVVDAALATRQAAREIYRLVETGQLHFGEDEKGLLYVCFNSIQKLLDMS
jgi:hypothetical protein